MNQKQSKINENSKIHCLSNDDKTLGMTASYIPCPEKEKIKYNSGRWTAEEHTKVNFILFTLVH